MEKLNRKGFFSTLFGGIGGIAGIVAGTSVKASEPTPVVETVVYCDKLVFTHSSGASCVMQFRDSDNFEIKVNNSENISINICSPLNKPAVVKAETNSFGYYGVESRLTIASNGNIGLGTHTPTAKLDIRCDS
jgi:hypothetical protein